MVGSVGTVGSGEIVLDLAVVLVPAGLGLITATIAKGKGRSFVAWWLFGALLFVVALPMALLMSPRPEMTTTRQG